MRYLIFAVVRFVAIIGDGALPPQPEKERFCRGCGRSPSSSFRLLDTHWDHPATATGDGIEILPDCTQNTANEFIAIAITAGLDHMHAIVGYSVGTVVCMDHAAAYPRLSYSASGRGGLTHLQTGAGLWPTNDLITKTSTRRSLVTGSSARRLPKR